MWVACVADQNAGRDGTREPTHVDQVVEVDLRRSARAPELLAPRLSGPDLIPATAEQRLHRHRLAGVRPKHLRELKDIEPAVRPADCKWKHRRDDIRPALVKIDRRPFPAGRASDLAGDLHLCGARRSDGVRREVGADSIQEHVQQTCVVSARQIRPVRVVLREGRRAGCLERLKRAVNGFAEAEASRVVIELRPPIHPPSRPAVEVERHRDCCVESLDAFPARSRPELIAGAQEHQLSVEIGVRRADAARARVRKCRSTSSHFARRCTPPGARRDPLRPSAG